MRVAGQALILMAALALWPASPALASSDGQIQVNTGSGWHHDVAAPLFSVDNIVPGWEQTRTFLVRNDTSSSADAAVESTNIVERENGCVHGEAAVDTTCGPGEGELGHSLSFRIYVDPANSGGYPADPDWIGNLYDLRTPLRLGTLAPGGVAGIKMVAQLPMSVGDEVETDQVAFGLRIDEQDKPSVLGESFTRGSGGSRIEGMALPGASQLPFTGFDAWKAGLAGIVLIATGGAVVGLARSRRRASAAST